VCTTGGGLLLAGVALLTSQRWQIPGLVTIALLAQLELPLMLPQAAPQMLLQSTVPMVVVATEVLTDVVHGSLPVGPHPVVIGDAKDMLKRNTRMSADISPTKASSGLFVRMQTLY
jgi:hypothetical protein